MIWRERPSPNFGPRRGGRRPDAVVLHYTGMTSAAGALERLCDPAAEVSAHYLVGRAGEVWRLVPDEMRAWHAGRGWWAGETDMNSRSIGIEIDNPGHEWGAAPYPAPQMKALARLLEGLIQRWMIRPERIIAHSDLAPDRKADPGEAFPWRAFARRGLGIWPDAPSGPRDESTHPGQARFCEAAARFGYDPALLADAAGAALVLTAMRRRFRPQGLGRPLEPQDARLMAALADRWPGAPTRES